jgi:hypothetical protein
MGPRKSKVIWSEVFGTSGGKEIMKQYVVYETTTGYILRTGVCPDDDFAGQAGTGESVWEGTAVDDGSKMIDITADPKVVIDNPGYVAPVLPTNIISDMLARLERLENPLPETLTVTFSGITNHSAVDDPLVTGQAVDFNTTFELTQTAPGANTYVYEIGEMHIDVTLAQYEGSGGGIINASLLGNSEGCMAFYHGTNRRVWRGDTITGEYAGYHNYNSDGEYGSCFIH